MAISPEIEPPDSHYLDSAVGWLNLGVPEEAEADLAKISEGLQSHPDVLEVRWLMLAHTKRWEAALTVARALVEKAPERSSGWVDQAYALRRISANGLQQAWDSLLPAYDKFPKEPTIAFNLSCYACAMRETEQARAWLRRALKIGDRERIKQLALVDPDLEPLWEEIRKL